MMNHSDTGSQTTAAPLDGKRPAARSYRRAVAADIDQLLELALSSYGEFRQVLSPENWAVFEQGLGDREKLSRLLRISQGFVCTDDERIVGVAYLVPSGNPSILFPETWSYVRMVGVHPAARGQGIATALMLQCIECARSSGETVLALHTSEFMDTARGMYERLGFTIHSEVPPIFGKRYWIYTMSL